MKKQIEKKKEDESLLTKAAVAIGSAAGKVAAVVGASASAPKPSGKFVKKNKSRLPRKEKKSAKKTAAR